MSDDKSLVIKAFDLLNEQQQKLVLAYLRTGNKNEARRIAGMGEYGRDPFKSVNVRRAVNEGMRPKFDKAGLTFEKHLEYVASIAYGDPSEIAEIVKVNCRYCHGVDHKYQFTENEYEDLIQNEIKEFKKNYKLDPRTDMDEMQGRGFVMPLVKGGTGFNKFNEPDPMCPECAGEGQSQIVVHPSATSHPLFGGVSYDKNGNMIVKFRNQDAALEHMSRLMGFLIDKTEVTIVDHVKSINAARKRAAIKDAIKLDGEESNNE